MKKILKKFESYKNTKNRQECWKFHLTSDLI